MSFLKKLVFETSSLKRRKVFSLKRFFMRGIFALKTGPIDTPPPTVDFACLLYRNVKA